MTFTFKEVAEILKIIDASQCEEVVIELEGLRLVVRRGSPNGAPQAMHSSLPAAAQPRPVQMGSPQRARGGPSRAELSLAEGHVAVRAPMVGTFYRRPSP